MGMRVTVGHGTGERMTGEGWGVGIRVTGGHGT